MRVFCLFFCFFEFLSVTQFFFILMGVIKKMLTTISILKRHPCVHSDWSVRQWKDPVCGQDLSIGGVCLCETEGLLNARRQRCFQWHQVICFEQQSLTIRPEPGEGGGEISGEYSGQHRCFLHTPSFHYLGIPAVSES